MTFFEAIDLAAQRYRAGQLPEAEALYRHAIEAGPDSVEALHGLAIVLYRQSRMREAIDAFRAVLAVQPDLVAVHHNLGNALHRVGRLDEAEAAFTAALHLQPDLLESLIDLGIVLQEKGKLDDAIACFRRVIQLHPDCVQAHNNLGNALGKLGRIDESIASLRRAAVLDPNQFEVLINLSNALERAGRWDQAIACLRRAIQRRPRDVEAHQHLGHALTRVGRYDDAIAAFQSILRFEPDNAEAYNNIGAVLRGQYKIDEAEVAFCKAIARRADYPTAIANLAAIVEASGRIEESIAGYDQALALQPSASIASDRLLVLQMHPAYDPQSLLIEARDWDARYAQPLRQAIKTHDNERAPERRLRIGYVSGDFRDHVLGRSILPLLRNHNRSTLEVFSYVTLATSDAVTEQIRPFAGTWRDITRMDDGRAAQLIRNDKIDILVDLSLHTAHNRLLIFARKPAPMQVTYLGHLGTSGLSTLDYRLSDPQLDPPDADLSCYSEETIRLPQIYWAYEPSGPTPDVVPAPSLANGYVTFGCLAHFARMSPAALEAWAAVLNNVPNSRLLLHCPVESAQIRTRERFGALGISADRLEFVGYQPWDGYIQTYHRIDIALDPFPYGGGITVCDTLWMGVPVVTLSGAAAANRSGRSIVTNIGLPQLIARDPDDYVRIASDTANLIPLRTGMRQRMISSPLLDAARFGRDLAGAYRQMWRRYCGV